MECGEPTSACKDGETSSVVGSRRELTVAREVDTDATWEKSSATTSSTGLADLSDVVPSDIDILLSSFRADTLSPLSPVVGDSGPEVGKPHPGDADLSTGDLITFSSTGLPCLEESSLSLVTSTMTGPSVFVSVSGSRVPAFSSSGDW